MQGCLWYADMFHLLCVDLFTACVCYSGLLHPEGFQYDCRLLAQGEQATNHMHCTALVETSGVQKFAYMYVFHRGLSMELHVAVTCRN